MKERRINLIGMRFGKLLVIDRAEDRLIGKRPTVRPMWYCLCDCGRIVIRPTNYLRRSSKNGLELSCRHCNDVKPGDVFGNLTVVKEVAPSKNKTKSRGRRWLCRCSCGREKVVFQHSLSKSKVTSCGCLDKNKPEKRGGKGRYRNKYNIIENDTVMGLTRKGEPFYFDLCYLDLVKEYCWHTNQRGYLESFVYNQGIRKRIFLHRLVTNCPDGKIIDHIDSNPANNRLNNLRVVTSSENTMNARPRSDNTTGVRGVSFHPINNKYQVNICKGGKHIYLGLYEDINEAKEVYLKAAHELFGEYMYDESRDYENFDSAQE